MKYVHEKCDISLTQLLCIGYIDSDKDWIDLRCNDFDSLVDIIETDEPIPLGRCSSNRFKSIE